MTKKTILSEIIEQKQEEFQDQEKTDYTVDSLLENVTQFSKQIRLHDYQKKALEKATFLLTEYYKNYSPKTHNPKEEKQRLYKQYIDFEEDSKNILEEIDKSLKNQYKLEEVINRMSFWMATGSGKTLVIVGLVYILIMLIKEKRIPECPILILAPNEGILTQIKEHIDLFNNSALHDSVLFVQDLKSIGNLDFSNDNSQTIYFYRSDLLEEKEKSKNKEAKKISYKDYSNEGKWYLILDEAHKGTQGGKRKPYINAFIKKGFLFNFSATFTEPIDIISTIHNFNLQSFVEDGYGKNLKLMQSQFTGFNKGHKTDDFNEQDKKEVILESILTYTLICKMNEEIIKKGFYHKPLMLSVANTVSSDKADLKLFFKVILDLAKKQDDPLFKKATENLKKAINTQDENKLFYFYDKKIPPRYKIKIQEEWTQSVDNLNYKDILKYFYNSVASGEIEYSKPQKNTNEIAFKLKTSSQYFALLKIGDIKSWETNKKEKESVKSILSNFIETVAMDEEFFNHINDKHSPINLLMGSKIFSEGWDSNRPNVINFINIGSKDASKYVLQTIGRGIRLEPKKNIRKRYACLVPKDLKDIPYNFGQHNLLETVFIYATKAKDIECVLKELETVKIKTNLGEYFKVDKDLWTIQPLIPKYSAQKQNHPYPINETLLTNLSEYAEKKISPKVFSVKNVILRNDAGLNTLKILQEKQNDQFNTHNLDYSPFKEIEWIKIIDEYFNSPFHKVEQIRELVDGDIIHYNKIKSIGIEGKDLENLKKLLENYLLILDPETEKQKLKQKLNSKEISLDIYTNQIEIIAKSGKAASSYVDLDFIKEHYFNPVPHKVKSNKGGYLSPIIDVKSEVEFITKLKDFIKREESSLNKAKWMFSKIHPRKDNIYIPYIHPLEGRIKKFYPDFIFWVETDKEYQIIFIDPKGLTLGDSSIPKAKIQGFKDIFKSEKYPLPTYNNKKIIFNLWYYGVSNIADFKGYVTKKLDDIF